MEIPLKGMNIYRFHWLTNTWNGIPLRNSLIAFDVKIVEEATQITGSHPILPYDLYV